MIEKSLVWRAPLCLQGSMDTTKGLLRQALNIPGAGIHWYGKSEAVKGTGERIHSLEGEGGEGRV